MKKITIRPILKNKTEFRVYCGSTKVGYVHLFPRGFTGKSHPIYDVALDVSKKYYVQSTYTFDKVQKTAETLMRTAIQDMANELSKFEDFSWR
jgi:hypothetical protein